MRKGDFSLLLNLLKENSGWKFDESQYFIIDKKLNNFIREKNYTSIDSLIDNLKKGNKQLISQVVETLAFSDTSFFRDYDVFYQFENVVLPKLKEKCRTSKKLNIWSVFDEAPLAQVGTYTNGAKILRALIATEKDGAKQKEYFNLLMKVHDQRIQYLDGLNRLVKTPATKGDIIGAKAHDYFSMGGQDNNEAYAMFAEAVAAEKQNLPYYVLMEFVDASARKVKAEEAHKEQFVQDYIAASGYANDAFNAAKKESAKKNYQIAKENIDAHFINSGVATCDNLQAIYAPKVEASKTDLEYLKQVVKVMSA